MKAEKYESGTRDNEGEGRLTEETEKNRNSN